MKKILVILFISSFAHSEINQQSIELTCEVGGNIFYLYFEEDINKSWCKHHKRNVSPTDDFGVWSKKMLNKRNNFVIVTTLNETRIVALLGKKANYDILNLNRLNGRASLGTNSGECFKGFKEYNKSEI